MTLPMSAAPRTAVTAQVLTWGTVRAEPDQLAAWRKRPPPARAAHIAPAQLKHCEDQTIAALWAVCEALTEPPGDGVSFTDWGIIAAPCFCGRAGNAQSLERYRQEGAWGISPHMIPNHSMHAVSGTISQLFKIHGPNFGVGNGLSAAGEAWLVATTLLSDTTLPGLWLVLTGHDGEFLPLGTRHPGSHPPTLAAAFALVPGDATPARLQVRVGAEVRSETTDAFLDALPDFSLTSLIDELNRQDTPAAGMWRLPAGWLEVETP